VTIVLDASVAFAWVFEDEVSDVAEAVIDRVVEEGAIVPALWRFEIANGLRTAIRRRRIDRTFRNNALARLRRLPIQNDGETIFHAWGETLSLSDIHALTPYDAAYLELALRRRLPLATLDKDLRRAASEAGVGLV
jgi:predicted nucleic acid-binding protein